MNEISVIMGKNVAKGIGLDYHVLIYIASEGKKKLCMYNSLTYPMSLLFLIFGVIKVA